VPSYYRDPDAPAPNLPRRVGVVALIERGGALLLERRADFGTWGLIGGALDDDETVREAIVREIREESGLAVVSAELFGLFSDPTRIVAYPDGNVYQLFTVVFRVAVDGGDPVPSEESLELRLVSLASIWELDVSPAHVPILEAFLADPPDVVVA
jgi:ADP-ribose pyrophosphatase YjhB (NUDIX family)